MAQISAFILKTTPIFNQAKEKANQQPAFINNIEPFIEECAPFIDNF
jgi:hypothetical protein